MDKLETTLKSSKFKDKVFLDMDEESKLGVTATPTFFINGKKHQGVIQLGGSQSLIETELANSD